MKVPSTPLLASAFCLFAACALLFTPFMGVITSAPISYKNLPFPAESPVRAGQVVTLIVDRCNSDSSPLQYEVTRELIGDDSSEVIVIPSSTLVVQPGCHKVTSNLNTIPADTKPGRYHIEAVTIVKGWREYSVPWSTQSFDVTP